MAIKFAPQDLSLFRHTSENENANGIHPAK